MKTFNELRSWILQAKDKGDIWESMGELIFQIYESSPLQFNVNTQERLKSGNDAFLKFEERSPGTFTVAAATSANESIQYASSQTVKLDGLVEDLITLLPDGLNVASFVRTVQNFNP